MPMTIHGTALQDQLGVSQWSHQLENLRGGA
jgi:hypothetical protein